MTRNFAPFWWSLFSAGGMISAMVFPVLIVTTGVLIPLGLAGGAVTDHARLYGVVAHPLVRLALLAIVALPLYHWAHRFLYTLVELGLRRRRTSLAIVCYSIAVAGTLVAAVVLWRL